MHDPSQIWLVDMYTGYVFTQEREQSLVWPVRGGQ